MTTFVMTDVTTYVGGYDFTTDLNKVIVKAEVDELDATTFGGGGYKARLGGLRDVMADMGGFWQSATSAAVDPQVFSELGTADRPVTILPAPTETSIAYMFLGAKFSYEMFGQVGEITPFALSMKGTNTYGLVRGQLAKARGNVSATGAAGSALSLGAVGAGQYLYAALHVFSAGTTVTVQVQSDDDGGMSSPTTRGTIGPVTTTGGTWLVRVAGPITDTFWRLNVSAITGTFNVAGAIGIQ